MSNRRSIADFPRNEAGLVDEFIGTAYDTVKSVHDNLPEIQRLDDVLAEIPNLAEGSVDEALAEAMPPIREELDASVSLAQAWAEGTEPAPASKSSKEWAGQAEVVINSGLNSVDQLVSQANEDIDAKLAGLDATVALVEAAKDAAILAGSIYSDIPSGLAATPIDGYFSVPSPSTDEYLVLYRNVAGSAVYVDTYPSAQAVQAINKLIEEVETVITDSHLFVDENRFVLAKWLRDGTLDMLKTQLRNLTDGISVTDKYGFTSVRLGSEESNLHGLVIRSIPLEGIYFTDSYNFVVGKMTSSGAFFGVQQDVKPDDTPVFVPRIAAQKRTDHKQIIVYGQSLAVGHSALPLLSTVQPYNNLMVTSGVRLRNGDVGYEASSYVPLVESVLNIQGETPASSVCNGITRRAVESGELPEHWSMLGMSPGRSGWSIEQLSPTPLGSNGAFEAVIRNVQDCNNLSYSLGKTYSVWGYCWIQGESNHLPQWVNSPYQYMEYLLSLFDTMTKDVIGITKQNFLPYIFTYQVAAHRRYGLDVMPIALSQWRAQRSREDVVMASPCYIFPVAADNLHLSNEGSWLMGEYFSRAIYETMVTRSGKWRPLEPTNVSWGDSLVVIDFHVPRGKLVLDSALASITTNFGFNIRENGAVAEGLILDVSVVSDTSVQINLSRPAAIDAVLTYARGRPGDPSMSGPVGGPRGNLRDTHGDQDVVISPSGTSHALHNACVMFEYSRKNGF